jgi:hypothetical protein|tara:strand:- start:1599 stop:2255 length:657 start_codon:yes stop_codon:yes gene_type:complete
MKPLAHSYSAFKQFSNCPKQYQMQRITRVVKPSFGEASIYGNRIHEQLEHRLRDKTSLPAESSKYELLCQSFEELPGHLLVEQEMTLDNNLQPVGWWDKAAWLRVKADVLILHKDTAVVSDWKTGKHRPDNFQLEILTACTFKHYPDIKKVRGSFVWLKDMRMDHVDYTRDDEPTLWNKIYADVSRIEAAVKEDTWPAKPSGLCPWCPAKLLCEFANI